MYVCIYIYMHTVYISMGLPNSWILMNPNILSSKTAFVYRIKKQLVLETAQMGCLTSTPKKNTSKIVCNYFSQNFIYKGLATMVSNQSYAGYFQLLGLLAFAVDQ